MKKILPLLLLTPTLTNAECTPTPDCASIGYTQTSCETISLKCPFDQSKLYCFPCDSSYQYPCSEPNEYGDGESCNNKYKSCCNTDCVVGAIYYSDTTCNTCLDTSKTPIGIVVKDNELIMSQRTAKIQWGGFGTDISTLTNYETSTEAITDFNGKDNTSKIVAQFGENADITLHAGVFCYKYSTEGTNAGDWYLPAAGELYSYVNHNYDKLNVIYSKLYGYYDYTFFTSTENYSQGVYIIYTNHKEIYTVNKNKEYSVTCFLSIK